MFAAARRAKVGSLLLCKPCQVHTGKLIQQCTAWLMLIASVQVSGPMDTAYEDKLCALLSSALGVLCLLTMWL
jgi:hypothetical protein